MTMLKTKFMLPNKYKEAQQAIVELEDTLR